MPITPAINQPYSNNRHFNSTYNSYTEDIYKPLFSKCSIQEVPKAIEIIDPNVDNIPTAIREKIDRSNDLLLLKYNWDDDGALAVNEVSLKKATSFLEKYSVRILDLYGKNLIAPAISPVRDGSVDLEWNLKNSYLVVNFNNKDDFAIYYLALKDGEDILFDANGQINTKQINDKFISDLVSLS